MTFWYIGDEEPDDPRFIQAGLAAPGLYHMTGAWYLRQVRYGPEREIPAEGFIPETWVRSWPNGIRLANRLVRVGLWIEVDGGYRYGWIRWQNAVDAVRIQRKRERDKWARKQADSPGRVEPNSVGELNGELDPPVNRS